MACYEMEEEDNNNKSKLKSSKSSKVWGDDEEEEDDDSDVESMKFGSTTHLTRLRDDESAAEESFRSGSVLTAVGGGGGVGIGGYGWQGTFVSSLLLVLLICLGLYLGRTYVKAVLLWMEYQNQFVALLLFILLFTLVSFPFMWGYILLNVVCGYLYGFLVGLLIVVFTVLVGTTFAHLLMRRCFSSFLAAKLSFNGVLKATLMVVSGPHKFRVVAITRLTPIPFGLQNALFALSPIGTLLYLAASVVGLLPTQAINAYLGSTLRSMEDVLSDANTATTGYVVFAVQLVISVCLTAYVVHKAKQLLREVVVETEVAASSSSSSIIDMDDVSVPMQ